MPAVEQKTESYALEMGGPERLVVRWSPDWKEASVQLDGFEPIGLSGRRALRKGQSLLLPDGTELFIRAARRLTLGLEWDLRRDNLPLPESLRDPWRLLRDATGYLIWIGVFTALFGIGMELAGTGLAVGNLGGIGLVLAGALNIGLAVWARARASALPLLLGLGLLVLDTGLQFVQETPSGSGPPIGMLLFRAAVLIVLWRGLKAAVSISRLRRHANVLSRA